MALPSPRHRGSAPPPCDTCHFPLASGNVVTYTSKSPVSVEAYATHFPSGEICPFIWFEGPDRNGRVWLPSAGNSTSSYPPLSLPELFRFRVFWYVQSTWRPSGDQLFGITSSVASFSESSSFTGSNPLAF